MVGGHQHRSRADRGQVRAAVAGEQLVSIPSLEFTERAAIIVPPPRMG